MQTREITIRVTPQAANVYETASKQKRRKLDVLLSLRLSELSDPSRSIEEIMRDASQEGRKAGSH